jgi:hypothetical protein
LSQLCNSQRSSPRTSLRDTLAAKRVVCPEVS